MNYCASPEQLQFLLDGQLNEADCKALETHVEGCAHCQEVLADLLSDTSEIHCRLQRMTRPPDEPEAAEGFLQRLEVNPPASGDSSTPGGSGPATIHFPGPPTAKGPLGRLGPLHVCKELGAGRFGVVYLAYDDGLGRTVAVKVLKPELADSAKERARFESETHKAASVKHDHIVTIYNVGAAPDFSLPYMVMEYIDGETLRTRLGRQGALPPQEAARIVFEVARGLAAAHARALVHRDIKPSNILLEKDTGRAKITDFGLARLLEAAGAQASQSEPMIGTPAYMSPEQINAPGRVDGRTDVYSLGVVLYELLTGERPFRGAMHMVLEQVVHEEPRPPHKLNDKIPRDLETVALKCLNKEPGQRYQTAGELADDLQRWLNNEPIRARSVRVAGKLWRWCRRKPALASMTAGLVLAVVAGIGGAAWFTVKLQTERDVAQKGWDQAEQAQKRAEGEQRRAEAGGRLLRETLEQIGRLPNDKNLLQESLKIQVRAYEKYLKLHDDKPDSQAERGLAFMRLGYIIQELGLKDEAIGYYQQAQAIFENLARDHPKVPEYRVNLAGSYNDLGLLNRAIGQLPQALDAFQNARARFAALACNHPKIPEYRANLGKSYNNLALVYFATKRPDEAEKAYQEAFGIFKDLAREHPKIPDYRFGLATTLKNLAHLYQTTVRPEKEKGDYLAKAVQAHEAAQRFLTVLTCDHPKVPEYQDILAGSYLNLGLLYHETARPKEAEQAFLDAWLLFAALANDHPNVPEHALNLGNTQYHLGTLGNPGGQPEDALAWYDQAITTLQSVLDKQLQHATARKLLRNAHAERAGVRTLLDLHSGALADWDRALELRDESRGERRWRLQRAMTLARLKDHAQATDAADDLAKGKDAPAALLYDAALVYALSAAAASDDARLAEQYAARAVELLRQAFVRGYKDVESLRKAPDLKSLWSRADFQELLRELEQKVKPGAK